MGQHELALSPEVRVLLKHLLHLVVEVFHLVSTRHQPSSVHTPAAVHKNYCSPSPLVDLLMKISNKIIDIVQIHKKRSDMDGAGDEGRVVEGIQQ